ASFARTVHSRVTILPTVINTDIYYSVPKRTPGPLRVGWSGSRLSFPSLYWIEPVIAELAQRLAFEFVVIAEVRPNLNWPGVNWRYIPWTPETEVAGLQEIDIGIMPLEDNPSERGKCGLKAIQYGGVGIPAVVSPVGINKDIVLNGATGFHCSSQEEWLFNLNLLLGDNQLCEKMGMTGRKHIEKYYSIKSLLPNMVELFHKVASL
ncbi:MAG: glycosyltransferase family 1 protein, partial [Firmicutes bacterium]|nr:glycosyltransferase family 1 protein [Bacillota bacterium]